MTIFTIFSFIFSNELKETILILMYFVRVHYNILTFTKDINNSNSYNTETAISRKPLTSDQLKYVIKLSKFRSHSRIVTIFPCFPHPLLFISQ